MEIIGKVVRLGNLTEGTSARGPWRKQELIIETEEQYPRTVCLICWTNQIDEIQKFAPGQTIKAQIELFYKPATNTLTMLQKPARRATIKITCPYWQVQLT